MQLNSRFKNWSGIPDDRAFDDVFLLSQKSIANVVQISFSYQLISSYFNFSDDSLGYEYPFALKIVQKDGFTCAKCPWYR